MSGERCRVTRFPLNICVCPTCRPDLIGLMESGCQCTPKEES